MLKVAKPRGRPRKRPKKKELSPEEITKRERAAATKSRIKELKAERKAKRIERALARFGERQ